MKSSRVTSIIHANVPLSKPMDTEAYTWTNNVQDTTYNNWLIKAMQSKITN